MSPNLSPSDRLVVAGIDPSLTSTGVAVVLAPENVQTHRIRSAPSGSETVASRSARLSLIRDEILEKLTGVDIVGIESPAYSVRSTGKMHDRSGLWWLIVSALWERGVEVVEVAPTARATYATGRGNAGKDDVLARAVRTYKHITIEGNDVADAVIIAAMMARLSDMPIEVGPVGADRSRALAKVDYPQMPVPASPARP